MNKLTLNIENYGLEESKAKAIKNLYLPMLDMLEEMEQEFNEVVKKELNDETIKESRSLRLRIVKVRTSADVVRQNAKEESIRLNKAIQSAYNTLEFAIKSKEEKLKAIEDHYENLEKEKIAKLQEDRFKKLEKYTENPDLIPTNLGEMDDEVWANYLTGSKTNYENRIEAERKAEEDRKKFELKQKTYNERHTKLMPYSLLISIKGHTIETTEDQFKALLKRGQDAKKAGDKVKKDAKIEVDRVEKEKKNLKKLHEKRYEKRGTQLVREFKFVREHHNYRLDGIRMVYEHELKGLDDDKWAEILKDIKKAVSHLEQTKKDKAELDKKNAELKAVEDGKIKAEKDKKAIIEAEAKKGDQDKLNDLIKDLSALKTKYVFESEENKEKYEKLGVLIDKCTAFLRI